MKTEIDLNNLDQDDIEHLTGIISETLVSKQRSNNKSIEKVWNYVQEVVRKEPFIKKIQKYRKTYKRQDSETVKSQGADYLFDGKTMTFGAELCLEYKIPHVWGIVLADYIITGKLKKPHGDYIINSLGLCEVQIVDSDKLQTSSFPVKVGISPYTSKSEIIDFVKKNYKETIEPIQKLLRDQKSNLDKVRQKKEQERNDYIWDNRKIGSMKLMEEVNKKFYPNIGDKTLGASDITGIISDERKKRS